MHADHPYTPYNEEEQETITVDERKLTAVTAPNQKGNVGGEYRGAPSCLGCYFNNNSSREEDCFSAPCTSDARKDGRTVIFVTHEAVRA